MMEADSNVPKALTDKWRGIDSLVFHPRTI